MLHLFCLRKNSTLRHHSNSSVSLISSVSKTCYNNNVEKDQPHSIQTQQRFSTETRLPITRHSIRRTSIERYLLTAG